MRAARRSRSRDTECRHSGPRRPIYRESCSTLMREQPFYCESCSALWESRLRPTVRNRGRTIVRAARRSRSRDETVLNKTVWGVDIVRAARRSRSRDNQRWRAIDESRCVVRATRRSRSRDSFIASLTRRESCSALYETRRQWRLSLHSQPETRRSGWQSGRDVESRFLLHRGRYAIGLRRIASALRRAVLVLQPRRFVDFAAL